MTLSNYSEFSSIYPQSGEGYLYARRTFAPPLAYFVGWTLLLGYTSSCAFYLAQMGYDCTVFEALPEPGGMAAVGIPDYRLPRKLLQHEVSLIEGMGAEIRYNTDVGTDVPYADLVGGEYKGYDGPWEKTPKPPESSLRYRQIFFERGGRE